VIDPLGGEHLAAAVGASAVGARLVNLGSSAGLEATLDVKALQGRTLIGHGTNLAGAAAKREAYERLVAHVLAGELTVAVERFGFADVAAAWARQAQSPHAKVVLSGW
jgi:NADPH2:quinone reductase